jgi:hypothetical protein
VLNVLYLDELLAWASNIKFDTYHWNMLHGPEELSIAALEEAVKNQIIQQLNKKFSSGVHYNDVQNVIAMMNNGTSQDRELLIEKLSTTDRYRKQHLRQTHPELAEILNYGN